MRGFLPGALFLLMLTSCVALPPVVESREALWQQFAHQSVDSLLLDWGAPAAETRLTDGSRLLVYRHATTYNAQSPYELTVGCAATFRASSPHYRIENVAMEGDAYECQLLAKGRTGSVRIPYNPSPHPYYSHHSSRFYRYPF